MKLSAIKFQLSEQTLKNIEKSTKCSINELRTLSFDETRALLEKRNAVTKPNKIKQWFADKYKTIGEKLGLLKKQHNFYTHID